MAALMRYARQLGVNSIATKKDPESGLDAIIAIHNTDAGSAIGGTRFQPYIHPHLALRDAIQLAHRMAYKAAIMGLPQGGGKSVLTVPIGDYNRAKLFAAHGNFVESLGGDYIASLDAGTIPADMNHIATQTDYVIGTTEGHIHSVDPSIYTAFGVFRGMQAAIEHLGHNNFVGLTVAIQGVGHVGANLAKLLSEAGAHVHIADPVSAHIERVNNLDNITVHHPNDIIDVQADIFAPCALGGVINIDALQRLKATMIVGAANNQLSHARMTKILADKHITYLPDFVVNAGGLISASATYHGDNEQAIYHKLNKIYELSKEILSRSAAEQRFTNDIAVQIAEQCLQKNRDKR